MGSEVNKGQLRPDKFPEVMGLTEAIAVSGRVATSAMSHYKDLPDYPQPIAELACGPVYLGDEVRAFWARHPITKRLTVEEKNRIKKLALEPSDDAAIAEMFGVKPLAIGIIRRAEQKRREAEEKQP